MYRSFIDALGKGKSLNEVCDINTDICKHYGYDNFSYSIRIPVSLVTQQYLVIESQEARTHPGPGLDTIGTHIRQYIDTTVPTYWQPLPQLPNQDILEHESALATRPQKNGQGLTIPMRTQHAGAAVMHYKIKGMARKASETIDATLPEMFLLANHAHEAINRFISYDDYRIRVSPLSNREKECLRWSTEGLTTTAISSKMGITHSTVTFHLQNAMRKLGASNRQQAIARALMLGVIA